MITENSKSLRITGKEKKMLKQLMPRQAAEITAGIHRPYDRAIASQSGTRLPKVKQRRTIREEYLEKKSTAG
jgi:hypothetical protein